MAPSERPSGPKQAPGQQKGGGGPGQKTGPFPMSSVWHTWLSADYLSGVKKVKLSPESSFLKAEVITTFLCLGLLWNTMIFESLIPPGNAVRVSEIMPIKL